MKRSNLMIKASILISITVSLMHMLVKTKPLEWIQWSRNRFIMMEAQSPPTLKEMEAQTSQLVSHPKCVRILAVTPTKLTF